MKINQIWKSKPTFIYLCSVEVPMGHPTQLCFNRLTAVGLYKILLTNLQSWFIVPMYIKCHKQSKSAILPQCLGNWKTRKCGNKSGNRNENRSRNGNWDGNNRKNWWTWAILVAKLLPRVSDKLELAPHWVQSSIRKLLPGRCSCFVIVGPLVVVYRLT